jgi:hypothetical protein
MVPPRAVQASALASDTQGRNPASVRRRRNGLLVREGESGFQRQRLTRSIHKLHVVKSGVGTVGNQDEGGFRIANHDTGKNSPYSEVLVRIQCSYCCVLSPARLSALFQFVSYPPMVVKKLAASLWMGAGALNSG